MNDSAQRARIERLHPWFALQLHFAEVFASKTGLSLDTALTFYTNFHRRFGFGRPSRDGRSPEWDDFVQQLVALWTRAERVERAKTFAREHWTNWHGTTVRGFGCFSFDAPNEGIVRLHFAPNDTEDGIGPLSRLKYARRIKELTDMFAFIRREHPVDARCVVGGSWLYNLDAYTRLSPSAYVESLRIHTAPRSLAGGSWWGQFVDHKENIVAERVRRFSESLPYLDPDEVWKVFPLPAMTARAGIAVRSGKPGSHMKQLDHGLWVADQPLRFAGLELGARMTVIQLPSGELLLHSPITRLAFRLSGAYRRLAPTYFERLLIRDRASFRASLQRVLEWPFERVIVAHGTVLEAGGQRELARGYSWLLGRA